MTRIGEKNNKSMSNLDSNPGSKEYMSDYFCQELSGHKVQVYSRRPQ